MSEADDVKRLLDTLPIYATGIGFRTDSTAEERRIGDAAFAAYRAWRDVMEAVTVPGEDTSS